jgi:hypothetical protein
MTETQPSALPHPRPSICVAAILIWCVVSLAISVLITGYDAEPPLSLIISMAALLCVVFLFLHITVVWTSRLCRKHECARWTVFCLLCFAVAPWLYGFPPEWTHKRAGVDFLI